jgi:hypothetical protein
MLRTGILDMDLIIESAGQDAQEVPVVSPERSSNHLDEAYLFTQALGGNKRAFTFLVLPHLRLFTCGIHRILQDPDETRVVLKEALLHIHRELDHVQSHGKFPIWAYRICLDRALSFRRSRMRKEQGAT